MNRLRKTILIYAFVAIKLVTGPDALCQVMTSYNLQFLPQRGYMNPAFVPREKMHVGIPLLSGISNSFTNNGFRYDDLFHKNNKDALVLDFENMVDHLQPRNNLILNFETELLSFGTQVGKNYFSLNITEKADFNFNYSKALIEYLYLGNAATLGTTQQLNPQIEGIHYREYGLSYSRKVSSILTTGFRLKYIYGMEHLLTKGTGITLFTDPVDYDITASTDFTVYTSGLDSGSFKNFNAGNYVLQKQNSGYGIDAGFIFSPINKIQIAVSMIDFGSITWKTDNVVYNTDTKTKNFYYSGINLDEFINSKDSLNGEAYLSSFSDSLYESLNVETDHEKYTSKLPTKFYISGSYLLSPDYTITALMRNKKTYHKSQTDYQLNFTGILSKWINYSVSLNRINYTPVSIGAGFCLNLKRNQVYFATDNVKGVINWKNSFNTGFRAGLNVIISGNSKKTTPPQPAFEEPTSAK